MTTADSQVTVTQADRDAAANYLQRRGELLTVSDYRRYVEGRYDASDTVIAFARNRLAAEKRERAACAEVAGEWRCNFSNNAHEAATAIFATIIARGDAQ